MYLGTRHCSTCMKYKRSYCSNKGNNIRICTSPCEHRAAPICCALLVKGGGKGVPRCHFQNNQNLVPWHCFVQNKSLVSSWGGFSDPGLPLLLLGRALITNALLTLPNHPEEMKKKKGKTGKNFTLKLENKQNRKP